MTTLVTRAQLLRLAMKGLNAVEAAKVVGVNPVTARSHYADPSFRAEVRAKIDVAFEDVDAGYAARRKSLHEMISDQAMKSFEDLVGMLEDSELHPSIRVKINQDFLNRTEESQAMHKVNTSFDPNQLKIAAGAAREMDNVIEMKRKVG